ncbi:hypothetical protein C5Y96_17755 [Blastopirellula marina]|uniref:Uncharacterized protein n=1 Tax=Blastopirellula marina TaxID=124 RepID=A0A2S8F5F1_9BACT|nr:MULTISPECIES: hypothetical protein [Pirellulaceae]PQO27386.1 hypothetical protein C5Y96_17755 [Blastopirellula marina]RCS47923.1 hypothetical protein DTL36_17780 [Bremerella cremea]
MNPYSYVLSDLFVDPHSQHNELAWLHGVLVLGEGFGVSANGNPYQAVLDDLASRGFNANALARVRQMLQARNEAYQRGQR